MSDARSHVDFRDCVAVAICLGENIRDETEPFQFFCALIEAGISSPISRILSVSRLYFSSLLFHCCHKFCSGVSFQPERLRNFGSCVGIVNSIDLFYSTENSSE